MNDDWPWQTLDAWCRDFEQRLIELGYKIERRSPGPEGHTAGYIYVLRDPKGLPMGCWIPEGETKRLMPRTVATVRFGGVGARP